MVTVSICAASWHCRSGLKTAVRVHHKRHTPTPPRVTCSFSNQTLTHRQGTLKSDLGKLRPCKIPQILTLFPFFLPFIIGDVQQSVLFVSHTTLDHRCFTHISMCFKSTLCWQNDRKIANYLTHKSRPETALYFWVDKEFHRVLSTAATSLRCLRRGGQHALTTERPGMFYPNRNVPLHPEISVNNNNNGFCFFYRPVLWFCPQFHVNTFYGVLENSNWLKTTK